MSGANCYFEGGDPGDAEGGVEGERRTIDGHAVRDALEGWRVLQTIEIPIDEYRRLRALEDRAKKAKRDEWLLTYPTGTHLFPFDPKPEQVRIEDMAHGLARVCRSNGLLRGYYSVAQHSLMVADILRGTVHEPHALIHDGAEYVFGDQLRPVKLGLVEYSAEEKTFQRFVYRRYGLSEVADPIVKEADEIALAIERRDLHVQQEWMDHDLIPTKFRGLRCEDRPIDDVETDFLIRFGQLFPDESFHSPSNRETTGASVARPAAAAHAVEGDAIKRRRT